MKRLQEDILGGWSRLISPTIPQRQCLGPVSRGVTHSQLGSAKIGTVGRITIRSTRRKKVS